MLNRNFSGDRGGPLLVIFVVGCTCSAGFIALCGWNGDAFLWLNRTAAQYLPDAFPASITIFGEMYWSMAVIAPCLLVAPRVNAALVYAAPFMLAFTHIPKTLLELPRPSTLYVEGMAHFINAPTAANTFPSGHAVVVAATAAVFILGREHARRQIGGALLALALASVVAVSRIAVGAHWPTDVLVGAGAGGIAGWLGIRLTYRHARWQTCAGRHVVAVLFLIDAVVLAMNPIAHHNDVLIRGVLASVGAVSSLVALMRLQEDIGRMNTRLADDGRGLKTTQSIQ